MMSLTHTTLLRGQTRKEEDSLTPWVVSLFAACLPSSHDCFNKITRVITLLLPPWEPPPQHSSALPIFFYKRSVYQYFTPPYSCTFCQKKKCITCFIAQCNETPLLSHQCSGIYIFCDSALGVVAQKEIRKKFSDLLNPPRTPPPVQCFLQTKNLP